MVSWRKETYETVILNTKFGFYNNIKVILPLFFADEFEENPESRFRSRLFYGTAMRPSNSILRHTQNVGKGIGRRILNQTGRFGPASQQHGCPRSRQCQNRVNTPVVQHSHLLPV